MPFRVRIKLCGMTRAEDIAYAAALGVDAIGLIFHPQSLRFVSLEDARLLLRTPPLFVDMVAVLVNMPADDVRTLLQTVPVQYLQFHGDESPAFCRQFRMPYIKAIAAHSSQTILDALDAYDDAAAILLDTPDALQRGGSGRVFDWNLIPAQQRHRFILAGGLNPDNVADAVSHVSPGAVDVSSGVERSPGIKDPDKMTHFVHALRGTNS